MRKPLTDTLIPGDPLANALKAATDTPAFSPSLHNRIMARLADQRLASEPPHAYKFPLRTLTLLATAAALIVAASVWLWPHGETTQQKIAVHSSSAPAPQHVAPTTLSPIGDLITNTVSTASDRLNEGRYAYLDRDARSLVGYVMDQLDVAPTH
jgi:hypothetical protein